jgi:hypothetical protein
MSNPGPPRRLAKMSSPIAPVLKRPKSLKETIQEDEEAAPAPVSLVVDTVAIAAPSISERRQPSMRRRSSLHPVLPQAIQEDEVAAAPAPVLTSAAKRQKMGGEDSESAPIQLKFHGHDSGHQNSEDAESIDDFQSQVNKVFTNVAVQSLVELLGTQIKKFENIPGKLYCAEKKITY